MKASRAPVDSLESGGLREVTTGGDGGGHVGFFTGLVGLMASALWARAR